jgi:hypothetical protein
MDETNLPRRVPIGMRLLVATFVLLGMSAGLRAADVFPAATAEQIALFKDAIKNTEQDPNHWAYTETTVKQFGNGKEKGATVVRVDPSKPYAEQFLPLKIDGKPPTEKQLRKYRERGEKHGKQLAGGSADPAPFAPVPAKSKEKSMKLDLEHPRVVSDDGDTLVFQVPLIDHGTGIPPDKIEVRVVVAKAARHIRHASLRVLESFRVKVVAKVKAGEGSIDFAVVDPAYGPVMTAATGSFGASLLFVPVNGVFASTRTDWQRVKPYDERFGVKIGPLKALDF